jgi:hypothetical protein
MNDPIDQGPLQEPVAGVRRLVGLVPQPSQHMCNLSSSARTPVSTITPALLALALLLGVSAHARIVLRGSQNLPYSGGISECIGDITPTADGFAAVYSHPVSNILNLVFYRFGHNAETLVKREHALAGINFYEPALCYDGQNFGVVAATFTQALFFRLSPDGTLLSEPLQLPGLGTGAELGRTAAFRVIWTGQGYAVFGLWMQKQFPLQDLGSGNFYTHLNYWFLDKTGTVVVHRELRHLAPMAYPGIAPGEKVYYDVVWTGQKFFVAYHSESESGPPFSAYYRLYDLQGNEVRGESSLWVKQTTQGARLAWNGRTIAATGLKAISLPSPDAGNYMYLRCFDQDGNPRGEETLYGQKLGFGPTLFWAGDKFVTAYVVMYNMMNLTYALFLQGFTETGLKLGDEYPLTNSEGSVQPGRMALAMDLQFLGGANVIYGKAQTSDMWDLARSPFVFTLKGDAVLPPQLTIVREGDAIRLAWPAEPTGFQLQETPAVLGQDWTGVGGTPELNNGAYTLTLPISGTRFYRLLQ